MSDATRTWCIHHPNMEAVNRCKQCTTPTCHKCTVIGPTGKFCSENCRNTHEAFIRSAQATTTWARSAFFVKLRGRIGSLIVLAGIVFAGVVVGSVFEIPLLSPLAWKIRGIIGF